MDKVFCIGSWKTGTTSIGHACNSLIEGLHGSNTDPKFRVAAKDIPKGSNASLLGPKRAALLDKCQLTDEKGKLLLDKLTHNYTTFDDAPWNRLGMISLLHKHYPQYKYVLSTRDPNDWHYSAYSFYQKSLKNNLITFDVLYTLYDKEFKFIFGEEFDTSSIFDRDLVMMIKQKSKWVNWFNLRNEYIKNLFSPSQLLEYNISNNLGWEPLCTFLDKPIPMLPFPIQNKS